MSIIFGCAGLINLIKAYLAEDPQDIDFEESIFEALRQVEKEYENPPQY